MKKVIMLLLAVMIIPVIVSAQMPDKNISQPQGQTLKDAVESKAKPEPQAQTITCPLVKDTWVYAFRPDSNYGNGYGWKDRTAKDKDLTVPKMFLGFGGADIKVILLQFDLSKLPKDKTPVKAEIKLYNDIAGSAAETRVTAKMITAPWEEMKVTWRNRPKWTSMIFSTQTLKGEINYGQGGKWYTWDALKLLNQWVSKGKINYGLALVPEGESGVDRDFICREYHGKEQFYPVLEVTYVKESPAKKPVSKDSKQ
ncbi:DNRLRE domain-containing protein [candidate division TA06 bacterium]|nr:DNRLRE domain-containing protein [candidate division TA06 bacterium]